MKNGGIMEVHLDVLTDCGADFVIDHFPLVALALVAGAACGKMCPF